MSFCDFILNAWKGQTIKKQDWTVSTWKRWLLLAFVLLLLNCLNKTVGWDLPQCERSASSCSFRGMPANVCLLSYLALACFLTYTGHTSLLKSKFISGADVVTILAHTVLMNCGQYQVELIKWCNKNSRCPNVWCNLSAHLPGSYRKSSAAVCSWSGAVNSS